MAPEPKVDADTVEDEYLPSLREFLRVIGRRFWMIALVMIVLVGAVVGLDLLRTPRYEASIKILVGQKQATVNDYNLGGDVQGLQQLTQTLTEAINSRPLAEAVIRQLNLRVSPKEFLEENMSAQQLPDTQFIQVSYTDTDPQRAQRVANAIGRVFSDQVSTVSPNAGAVTATVWEPAIVPDRPVSPNVLRDGLLALVLGGALGVGLALLQEYLDDSWRSPEEAEQISGMPTFGVIPSFAASQKSARRTKGEKIKGEGG